MQSLFISNPGNHLRVAAGALLIGMSLVADGLGFHIPKGYIYFAMGFSVLVEFLNLQVRNRRRQSAEA